MSLFSKEDLVPKGEPNCEQEAPKTETLMKVKEIYFDETGIPDMPKFEMEDGSIKHPVYVNDRGVIMPWWISQERYDELVALSQPKDNTNIEFKEVKTEPSMTLVRDEHSLDTSPGVEQLPTSLIETDF